MSYTKEEANEINKALNTVINDLESIWIASEKESVEVLIHLKEFKRMNNYDGYGCGKIYLNDLGIYITTQESYNEYKEITNYLARHTFTGKFKLAYHNMPLELCSEFVRMYPMIRSDILSQIKKQKELRRERREKALDEHNKEMEAIRKVEKLYHGTSDIEIDLPKTNNQHTIEISEENGRKIGTINFGLQTIRIITDGDIIIVPKETTKQKRIGE